MMENYYAQSSPSWSSGLPTPDRKDAHAARGVQSPPVSRDRKPLITNEDIDDDPFLNSPETSPRRQSLKQTPSRDKRKREAHSQMISPSKVVVVSSDLSNEGLLPSKRPKESIYIDHNELERVKNDPDWLQKRSGELMVDGDDAGPSEQPPTANPTSHPIDETNHETPATGQPKPDPEIPPSDDPTLCPEQQKVVDLILSGHNVFYTGSAGCGKSTVLKAAVKKLREETEEKMGKNVYILAPTGRAALQVDGMTTWSYMGWTPSCHQLDLDTLIQRTFRKHVRRRLRRTDVLIIDEISMVENHHLQRMDLCLRAAREYGQNVTHPFGGLQVILTGDFCQLPPVKPFEYCMFCGIKTTLNAWKTQYECPNKHGPFKETDKWAFQSQAWKDANLKHVHLNEIHRQHDEEFIKILQKCRRGEAFNSREMKRLMDHECKVANATRILCTREEVNGFNRAEFEKLKTEVHQFTAVDGFRWRHDRHPYLEKLATKDGTRTALREHRIDPWVDLRVGMVVVLQVNLDLPNGLCNGSQGLICGWEDVDPKNLPTAYRQGSKELGPIVITGDYADLKEEQIRKFSQQTHVKQWPKVIFHNGLRRTIYPSCFVTTMGEGKDPADFSVLHRTQIPLVAGWAMTVHKSQGMTLNRVIVDVSRAFEEGQVYVALSRATNLEGLRIDGDANALLLKVECNAEVMTFLREKFESLKLPKHY
ncbi:unnamed protein product [Clonostachys chloroleuca]|uniref:ATP-dependent DNA helicase n=1 Tax=Clonostachys chloroleuca TaxID=1926264 RepID=A0AA35LQJ8_9HYPO|nr:unnamed protein product [Clonostachys chloroleuca]